MRPQSSSLRLGLVLAMMGLPPLVSGQTQIVGAIEGQVKDESGGVLPGVAVTVTSPALIEGSRTSSTDERGNYRALRLPVGEYSVSFTLQGFSPFTRESVVINSGFTATINAVLKIGSLEETVTVVGESPIIDVKGTTVQTIMTDETIDTIPNARTVFDVTKFLVGASTSSPDVGGSSTVLYTSIQIHGSQGTDRSYYRDGLRVAAYFGGGDAPRVASTVGAMEEVNYQYSALPASVANGGMNINMVFKEGGDDFQGSLYSSFGSDAFQSTNLDDELRNRGVRATAGIEKVYDVDGTFGGPIKEGKAWFFGSLRVFSVTNLVANQFFRDGSQAQDFQRNSDYIGKAAWQASPNNKLSVSFAHDAWSRPFRRVGATFVEPEALLVDKDGNFPSPFNRNISTRWTNTSFENWILEAGWAYMRVGAGWEPQPGVRPTDIARMDLVTQTLSVAPSVIRGDASLRDDFFFSATRLFNWKGTHEIKFGTQNAIGDWRETRNLNGDIVLYFRNGVPDSVDLANTPLDALSHLTELGFYIQDSWSIANRLTINAGVRYDKFRINIADRTAPAGTWVPERQFAEIKNVPNWDNVVPRLGVSFDPLGTGRTVIKGSFSVYVGNEAVGVASAVNPMFYSANRCAWADSDGDLMAQASELSRCSGFAGGVSTTHAPDLERQFNREYTAGVQHELAPNLALSVNYYRRENRNLRGIQNLAVPPSSYTPITITNPLTNEPLTIFNQDPATLGRQQNVLANSELLDNDYNGIEAVIQSRFSSRGSVLAGYHYGKKLGAILTPSIQTNLDINDPNNLIDYIGAVGNDEPHQFKLSGNYLLPGDVNLSGVLLAYSGHPRQQTLLVTRAIVPELTRPSQVVALERNDENRYDSITLLDLRVSRSFHFGKYRIEPFFDAYNIFNANTVINEVTTLGPSLGRVSQNISPRIFRIGAKLNF